MTFKDRLTNLYYNNEPIELSEFEKKEITQDEIRKYLLDINKLGSVYSVTYKTLISNFKKIYKLCKNSPIILYLIKDNTPKHSIEEYTKILKENNIMYIVG